MKGRSIFLMVRKNRRDLVLGCTHIGKIISGETDIAKFEILGFLGTVYVMHAGVFLPGQISACS